MHSSFRYCLSFIALLFLSGFLQAEEEFEFKEINTPKTAPLPSLYRVSLTQQSPTQNSISTRRYPVFQISLTIGGTAWAYWNESEKQISSVIAGPRYKGVTYKTEQKRHGFAIELEKDNNEILLTVDWSNQTDKQKQMQAKTTIPIQLNQWTPILQTTTMAEINPKQSNSHYSTRDLSKDNQSIFIKVEAIN